MKRVYSLEDFMMAKVVGTYLSNKLWYEEWTLLFYVLRVSIDTAAGSWDDRVYDRWVLNAAQSEEGNNSPLKL